MLVNLQLIEFRRSQTLAPWRSGQGACHIISGQTGGKNACGSPEEIYAHRALTVHHHLTGETVMVALSSREPPFSGRPCPSKTSSLSDCRRADRDLNGDGQVKPRRPRAVRAWLPLPPVFGWNDAFEQKGECDTHKAIYDAIRPPAQSPEFRAASGLNLPP